MSKMVRIRDGLLPPGTSELMQNNLHRALANNPDMAENFYRLAESVHSDARLETRIREFVILRVTSKIGSDFEFSHHFVASQTVGVAADEARSIRDGDYSRFSEVERGVLELADAIEESRVTDGLWQQVASNFSEIEMLDLVMAVGFYGYASRLCLALGVPADAGFPTIAEA
jgi:4-carboxymuconolactone decarboxylase